MKKLHMLLIVILISFSAFCETVGRFDFNAYYRGRANQEKWIELNIFDGTSNTQNAGIITLLDPFVFTEQGTGFDQSVFSWEIRGNYDNRLVITFTFLPLQAFLNERYFIPNHYFELIVDGCDFIAADPPDVNEQLYDNLQKRYNNGEFDEGGTYAYPRIVRFSTMVNDTYPYPSPYDANGKVAKMSGCVMLKANPSEGRPRDAMPAADSDYANIEWRRTGHCILHLVEYDQRDGDFNYISNVKVELSLE